MDSIAIVPDGKYQDKPETLVSVYPIEGSDQAMIRIDWFDDNSVRYCLLTNFRELCDNAPELMQKFIENGIKLFNHYHRIYE